MSKIHQENEEKKRIVVVVVGRRDENGWEMQKDRRRNREKGRKTRTNVDVLLPLSSC